MLSAHMRGTYAPPPVVQSTTPPALEPPTQTMFARGPVGGGHSSMSLLAHSLTTPPEPPTRHVARGPVLGHPSNGGELVPRRDEVQVPLCGGVARSAGGSLYSPPPVVLCTTPPALEPPTQTMFARGPVWRWAFGYVIARALSPLSFPRRRE